MVIKKIETRDYLRTFVTKANKVAGVVFNSSKLNSKEDCEKYLLNLIKDLKNSPKDNNAYIKEINRLKEEIEILNSSNKKLESERFFYITQVNEAKKYIIKEQEYRELYKNTANKYEMAYDVQKKDNIILNKINTFFIYVIVLEIVLIAMLIWK